MVRRKSIGAALSLCVALLLIRHVLMGESSSAFLPATRPGRGTGSFHEVVAGATAALLFSPAAAEAQINNPFKGMGKPFFAEWPAWQQVGAGVLIVGVGAAIGATSMGGEMIDRKTTKARKRTLKRRERIAKAIVEDVASAPRKRSLPSSAAAPPPKVDSKGTPNMDRPPSAATLAEPSAATLAEREKASQAAAAKAKREREKARQAAYDKDFWGASNDGDYY